MRVTVLGARGFVGSAFCRLLGATRGVEVVGVTRDTYHRQAGQPTDLLIDAAGNSRKFLADDDPAGEFRTSVTHRLSSLLDFPSASHLHISTVDVYPDLSSRAATVEDQVLDVRRASNYGFHKYLAEELVRHYAPDWLIVRLAGMVGPGLRKNPVFDILHDQPLRIHPDSQYQFLQTDDVARLCWSLWSRGLRSQAINVCGDGLVSPRDIANLAGRALDTSLLHPSAAPRIVDISTDRLAGYATIPRTIDAVRRYLESPL